MRKKIIPKRVCPVCKNTKVIELYKSDIYKNDQFNKFLVNEVFNNPNKVNSKMCLCNNCFLCYFDYRYSNEELDKLYSKNYEIKRSKYIEGFSQKFKIDKYSEKARAFLIRKLIVHDHYLKFKTWKKSAKILDFGGWHGMNIPNIADKTLKYVLDKSKHKTNADVIKLDSLIKEHKFDLIMSTHVFEHIINPLEQLKTLKSHLKNNGLIYLELPVDIVGLVRRPPMYEHINFFSRSSIRAMAANVNLEILHINAERYPYSYHDTIAYIVVLQKSKTLKNLKNITFFMKIKDIVMDILNYLRIKLFKKSNKYCFRKWS